MSNKEKTWGDMLREAGPEDFQVTKIEHGYGDITWAASLHGCFDIATFKRRVDCEWFIKNWKPVNERKRIK